jgi:hypothetical protein
VRWQCSTGTDRLVTRGPALPAARVGAGLFHAQLRRRAWPPLARHAARSARLAARVAGRAQPRSLEGNRALGRRRQHAGQMTRRWLASLSLARLALPPLAGRRRGVSSSAGASCIVHRRPSHRIGGFGSACLLLRVRFTCVTAKSSEQCVSMREIGSCPRHAQQPSNASVESRALTSLSFCCTRRVCMASGVSLRLRLRVKAPLRQRRDIDWRPDGDRMESPAPSMMMLMRCRQRGTARLRRLATGRHAPRAARQECQKRGCAARKGKRGVHADISAGTGRSEGLRCTGQAPHASV